MKSRLAFLLLCLIPLQPADAAIFGRDDRRYVRSSSPEFEYGRATAVAVLESLVLPQPLGKFDLWADSLSGLICPEDKFSSDPSLSYACTGFLVAPDLLVTAGHCMVNVGEVRDETEGYCPVYKWLFDYRMHDSGVQLTGISPSRLYSCKRILIAVNEEKPPYRDFALVQLDRPVTDRRPLKIARHAARKGDTVGMIGYPLGGPEKIAGPARVKYDDPARHSFVTSLDAFEGNSGSPVLNSRHQVVGILIAGTPSAGLVEDKQRGCSHYNQCKEDGSGCLEADGKDIVPPSFQATGSEVERISVLRDFL